MEGKGEANKFFQGRVVCVYIFVLVVVIMYVYIYIYGVFIPDQGILFPSSPLFLITDRADLTER